MTESERKGRLKDLFELLENDMASLYPRFPDQAIYALGDPRVTQALGKRFEQDVGLENITRLPYSMETGLNALSFEFTPGASGLPTTDAFLVIMDGNCRVAGVIDPFEPAQPNGFMPPLPREGAQPFVLSRPSPQVTFSDDELLAARAQAGVFQEARLGSCRHRADRRLRDLHHVRLHDANAGRLLAGQQPA